MKNKIIKDSSFLLVSGVLQKIIAFVQNILLLNILGPAYQGIRVALQTYIDYGNYSNLGSIDNLQKEAMQGKRENYSYVFGLNLILSIIFVILSIIISVIFVSNFYTRLSLIFASLTSLLINVSSLYSVKIRENGLYKELSMIFLLQSIFSIVLSILLTYYFGYFGFFISLLIVETIIIVTSVYFSKEMLKPNVNIMKFISIIKKGFPIFLLGIIITIFYSFDRFIVYKYYGSESLGIYSLGLIVLSAIMFTNQTIWKPIVNRLYDNRINQQNLMKAQRIANIAVSYIYIVFVCLTPFITIIFPKYTGSEWYVIVLGVSGIFYPYINITIYQKYSKEFIGLAILGLTLILTGIAYVLLFNYITSLHFFSLFISLMYILNSIIFSLYSNKIMGISIIDSIKEYLIVISIVLTSLIIHFMFISIIENQILAMICSLSVINVLYFMLFNYHNNKYKIFN